jgi:hypothetical protein
MTNTPDSSGQLFAANAKQALAQKISAFGHFFGVSIVQRNSIEQVQQKRRSPISCCD